MAVTCMQSVDTVHYADTVSWNGELLACGTYQLKEETGNRIGGVSLYRIEHNNDEKRQVETETIRASNLTTILVAHYISVK